MWAFEPSRIDVEFGAKWLEDVGNVGNDGVEVASGITTAKEDAKMFYQEDTDTKLDQRNLPFSKYCIPIITRFNFTSTNRASLELPSSPTLR